MILAYSYNFIVKEKWEVQLYVDSGKTNGEEKMNAWDFSGETVLIL